MLSNKDVLSFRVEQKGKIGVVLPTLINRCITAKKCNQCVKLSKLAKLIGMAYNELDGNAVQMQLIQGMYCQCSQKFKLQRRAVFV